MPPLPPETLFMHLPSTHPLKKGKKERKLSGISVCQDPICLVAKLCLTLLQPHGLQYARLLCSWDFPGKNKSVWGGKWKLLSRVWLFVTPWTIQSMELSRSEYWSAQPFPSPGDFPNPGMEPRSPTLLVDSLPAELEGVDCHFLLQGIFLTQGLNPYLLHWQMNSLSLSQQRSLINPVYYY